MQQACHHSIEKGYESVFSYTYHLDGRYHRKVDGLRHLFQRICPDPLPRQAGDRVAQSLEPGAGRGRDCAVSTETAVQLDSLAEKFQEADGNAVKLIEERTNHDVKASRVFSQGAARGQSPRVAKVCRVHPFRVHLRRHQQPVPSR